MQQAISKADSKKKKKTKPPSLKDKLKLAKKEAKASRERSMDALKRATRSGKKEDLKAYHTIGKTADLQAVYVKKLSKMIKEKFEDKRVLAQVGGEIRVV